MYTWRGPLLTEPESLRLSHGLPVFCFAAAHGNEGTKLSLILEGDASESLPQLECDGDIQGASLAIQAIQYGVRVILTVPAAGENAVDEELRFELRGNQIPPCQILLRRTHCRLSTALVATNGRQRDDRGSTDILPQTRAALLWVACKRFRQIAVVRRFSRGLSNAEVLVCRPQLSGHTSGTGSQCSSFSELEPWGSWLMVKTGSGAKILEEWQRFHDFLSDRLHAFVARSERLLSVNGPHCDADTQEEWKEYATILGSFVGGDLVDVESLEAILRTSRDAHRCISAVDKIEEVLSGWYECHTVRRFSECQRVFGQDQQGQLLVGKNRMDLRRPEIQLEYKRAISWDYEFFRTDHLNRHLLGGTGGEGTGLLGRLGEIPVRYSLIHGDLHCRNLLISREHAWLIDFGETEIGPTLFDFAMLEVFIRLWCLKLSPHSGDFDSAAYNFERGLMDQMVGTSHGFDDFEELADPLGVEVDDLKRIAQTIGHLRLRAKRYSISGPEYRDYFAILFSVVLRTLRFSQGNDGIPVQNYRLVLGLFWRLEDVLSRMVGIEPFQRDRAPMEFTQLLTTEWLAAPNAAARVAYLMAREDGRRAFPELAATIGVMQNENHHLDVFEHTLNVLMHIEVMLERPIDWFFDPPSFIRRAEESMASQGFRFSLQSVPKSQQGCVDSSVLRAVENDLHEYAANLLSGIHCLTLKWAAVLHDLGKASTRRMSPVNGHRRSRVNFRAHEVYSRALIRRLSPHLFPNPRMCELVDRIVELHHHHHSLIDRFLSQSRIEDLEKCLAHSVASGLMPDKELLNSEKEFCRMLFRAAGNEAAASATNLAEEVRAIDRDFLPLLLIFGFADVSACMGAGSTTPLDEISRIDLALMAFWMQLPERAERWQELDLATTAANHAVRDMVKRNQLVVEGVERGEMTRKLTGRAWDLIRHMISHGEEPTAERIRYALCQECVP